MNNLKYLSLLILSVFLSSCSRGILVDGNLEQVYEEAKLAFPASSTYFLPNLNAAKLLLFEVSLPHEGHDGKTPNYIHLLMEYPKDKMDSILRIAYETSITYSFNDQYLLILDYDANKIRHFRNLKAIKDTLDINPIPNFDFQNINQKQLYIISAGLKEWLRIKKCCESIEPDYLRIGSMEVPQASRYGIIMLHIGWMHGKVRRSADLYRNLGF